MSILVTGAGGYLGERVFIHLSESGHKVRALVRKTHAAYRDSIEIDLAKEHARKLDLSGIEVVVHCAGAAHQPFGTPDSVFEAGNVSATENLAIAAASSNVKQFIMISTVSVYGKAGYDGSISEGITAGANDRYGGSKLRAESKLRTELDLKQTELVILRPSTIVGPEAPGNVARLIELLARRVFLKVGNGRNLKSFVHVEDVCGAISEIIRNHGRNAPIYNISAKSIPVNEVISVICSAFGKRDPAIRLPAAPLSWGLRGAAWVSNSKRLAAAADSLSTWLRNDDYECKEIKKIYRVKSSAKEALKSQVQKYLEGKC